ncbi:hypothetical protein Tco_1071810 [Tanacetum coccineum]
MPVTYPDEVEEIKRIPIEVEPLDETPIEDLGLNTCNHDIPFSSREIPNFDEPEPQPQPFPSFPSLEVDLGEEIGPEPPIKPPISDSFRMKEVNHLTNHTPPLPHVEMIEYDWQLEPKEVSFLGRRLNLPVTPKELENVRIKETHHSEHIIQQPIFQHVTPSHNNGVYRYYHPHLNSSVGEPSPLSVKEG